MAGTGRSVVTRPAQDVPVLKSADVVVIGGGPGGLGAAVAAARKGARTLLVERYGCLGGMATVGLVNPFMTNHIDGQRLDSGIFAEWCDTMADLGGISEDGRTFNPEVAKLAAERLCLEAGVELLYHSWFDQPVMSGSRIDCALFCTKSGAVGVRGEVFVDATGDADLAARAGCIIEYGRDEDHLCQPMTTCFDVAGVEPEQMPNREGINELYELAKEQGRIHCIRENCLWFRTTDPTKIHFNTTRITHHHATDVESLTDAEIEGRRQIAEYLAWLRSDVPGFQNSEVVAIAMHVGIRESRRVRGEAYLTREDAERFAKYDDGICRCRYPIDIHNPSGVGTEIGRFPNGEWYEIPYGCIVPQRIDNLLIAGRPISVDHAVHSSMRVMPPACTVGQAAGAAAAMAQAAGVAPRQLDGRKVKAAMVEQGVWLVSGDEQVGPGGEMVVTMHMPVGVQSPAS